MHLFDTVLLILHVAGGLLALVVGLLPMGARKGGPWHARWGRIYYWTMMEVAATAAVMLVTRRYLFFLATITVLTFYSTFTGVRCLGQKGRIAANARGRWLDWLVTGLVGVVGAMAVVSSLAYFHRNPMLATVHIVFGMGILIAVGRDVARYVRPPADPKWWLYYHLGRMIGSYIGAVTAFLINRLTPHVPPRDQIFIWLGPTLVFVPVIVLWQTYYRRKFRKAKPSPLASATAEPETLRPACS